MRHSKWHYRPFEHDDWGMVRDNEGHPIGQIHDVLITDEEKNEHRKNNTDPYEKIAKLASDSPELLQTIKSLVEVIEYKFSEDEITKRLAKAKALVSRHVL